MLFYYYLWIFFNTDIQVYYFINYFNEDHYLNHCYNFYYL